jgi:hypothetical protein
MNRKFTTLLAAAVVALASMAAFSGSASAACRHPYKPMKHKSGNIVCVLDAVPQGLKLKVK